MLPGSGGGARFPAEETLAAKHRTPLGWPEGNRGFAPALGTTGYGFGFTGTGGHALALAFASFAAFRFIPKIFVVEEVLFSRCEYEVCSAIYALEDAILKLRHSNFVPYRPERVVCSGGARFDQARSAARVYSISRRDFFRFRLRASACLARRFSPGYK